MIQNTWLTIALYPGCVQGFFLVYLLWRKKDANRPAIGYFNALLLTISILMLLRVTYQPAFFRQFAEIILLPDVILFLTGPFIYLFTRALLRLDPLPKHRLWLHFIPALVHVSVVNTFLGLHLNRTLKYMNGHQVQVAFNMIEVSAMLSLGVYLALSLYVYKRYRAAFYQKYAAPFVGRFLLDFIVICFGLLFFWLAGFMVKVASNQVDYTIYTLFWVLTVAATYFLAYKIWATPAILELPPVLDDDDSNTSEEPISPAAIAALRAYMGEEKPYLNPEIKIGDLAMALNLPKHQLSKIINQGFGQNFFDFINGYRVYAFIDARNDPKMQHLNTLELAYASGFNSKSAFNRAFLKAIGRNPRDYFSPSDSVADKL